MFENIRFKTRYRVFQELGTEGSGLKGHISWNPGRDTENEIHGHVIKTVDYPKPRKK